MAKYIDADRIIAILAKRCDEADNQDAWFAYANACGDVRDLPAADVEEVKHGKWEELMEHRGAGGILGGKDICVGYACSECGEQFDIMTYYCPYCGAKMVNEDDDID